MKKIIIAFLVLVPLISNGQIITTIAGDGIMGYSSDGISATLSELNQPGSTIHDSTGNLFITDTYNSRIRKVNSAGIITTYVGTGVSGYSGDDGLADTSEIGYGVANAIVDAFGNLYFSDGNYRVRKVNAATGIITTIAGNGVPGFSGDSGLAVDAKIEGGALAIDKTGNIYIADVYNKRIRKIDTFGIITTYAGNGIAGFSGDGGFADTAEFSSSIEGLVCDTFGNLYISDRLNGRVREVDAITHIITTIAGDGGTGTYVASGIPATSEGICPAGLAVDVFGNLFIGDFLNMRVLKVDITGTIYSIAGNGITGYHGDGGLADTAEFNRPWGVSLDACGNLYIADEENNRIRKVTYPPTPITLTNSLSAITDTICASTAVTYTASATTSSGAVSYQWYVNGSIVSTTGNTYTYTPANGDSVRCVATATNACTSAIASSNTINMVVTPVTVPTITVAAPASALAGSVVTVDATVAGAGSSYSIKWYDNGVLFSTTTVPVTTYVQDTGTDVITATVIPTGETCSDTANSNAVSVSVGNEEAPSISPQGGGLSVFPNPVGDVLNIVGQDIAKVTVSNVLGQVVFTTPFPLLKTGVLRVVMAPFASAVYVVEVTDGDGVRSVVKVVKVVKE